MLGIFMWLNQTALFFFFLIFLGHDIWNFIFFSHEVHFLCLLFFLKNPWLRVRLDVRTSSGIQLRLFFFFFFFFFWSYTLSKSPKKLTSALGLGLRILDFQNKALSTILCCFFPKRETCSPFGCQPLRQHTYMENYTVPGSEQWSHLVLAVQ